MKSRNVADFCKNAVGAVFLLAGAFFVCSTLLSMRAVFADPIAPVEPVVSSVASPRSSGNTRAGVARGTNPRASARTTNSNSSRGVAARSATNQAGVVNARQATNTGTRSVTNTRANVSNGATRNVVSRGGVTNARVATTSRNVRSRDGATVARVSLMGSAIRGSKASVSGTTYTYLQSKLYTGNYSNIIDSTTGLISAEAYNNCMESYYTCMDEICTARNAAQRRCACAGRVRAFAEAEAALESANEELIKAAGELALLVASRGKDVSEAFQLTDAEKVMNCVSWQETVQRYGQNSEQAVEWCYAHNIYGTSGQNLTSCAKPNYCSPSGNNFGFDIANIDGSSSDILAQLQSWADAKAQTITILTKNDDSTWDAFTNLSNVVSGMAGIDGALAASSTTKDSLAETWGYELFEYAHNNVCNRVLDSCFNGIYEACGAPPSSGRKCSNGASQCPYNYNTMITVTNTGTYELNFVSPSNSYTASNSATCFGYTTSSGDPYSNLRGPVADARRSILQKYALDANADCDAYGEQLRTTAQNIAYQKVAAQQALQQKRLEFATEERQNVLSDALTAATNFNECLSDLLDCYENQAMYNPSWSTSRIKTYCAQVANVPTCYETMICNPSTAPFKAVIDVADNNKCLYTASYESNNCRNVVSLNDILNGAATKAEMSAAGADGKEFAGCDIEQEPQVASRNATGKCNSKAMRERCLLDSFVEEVRDWHKDRGTCSDGYYWDDARERCVVGTQD